MIQDKPVAFIEVEDPEERVSWRRAKLNEAGLKLLHGTPLYDHAAPCARCEEHKEANKAEIDHNLELQAKLAEQSAEIERLRIIGKMFADQNRDLAIEVLKRTDKLAAAEAVIEVAKAALFEITTWVKPTRDDIKQGKQALAAIAAYEKGE